MFTPKMIVAVRVLALLRRVHGSIWMAERHVLTAHGIHRVTLEGLARLGVVERNIDDTGARGCRLSPLAIAIIDAVRA